MKFTILYCDKTSTTGKLLLEKFKTVSTKAFRKRTNKRANVDLILRWGSTEYFPRLKGKVEINNEDSVGMASRKEVMMSRLIAAGIPTPGIFFPYSSYNTLHPFIEELVQPLRDSNGKFYVRGANQSIRYTDTVLPGDLYVSKPIENKAREYRVHVFDGEVKEIYEKIPNDPSVKLFKADNCQFSRRDKTRCRLNTEAQEVCVKAVKALELTFAGVDVALSSDGQMYVLEVNSAPSLNSINVERYFEWIMEYYYNAHNLSN